VCGDEGEKLGDFDVRGSPCLVHVFLCPAPFLFLVKPSIHRPSLDLF
jgi:hypothetical protein